jgi:hypothetical protein
VHSLVVGHLDSFQFVAFMNKSAVDILVHVVVYRDVSIFLGEIFRSRLLGHMVSINLVL